MLFSRGKRVPPTDLTAFQRWAMGDIVQNTHRGIFAEWMVGVALGVIRADTIRTEWHKSDLRYRKQKVEVKSFGFGTTNQQHNAAKPGFSVKKYKSVWDPHKKVWEDYPEPIRDADIYVFCMHNSFPATTENVADTDCWSFWVTSTPIINEDLGDQLTVRTSVLDTMVTHGRAKKTTWEGIQDAVDFYCQSRRRW